MMNRTIRAFLISLLAMLAGCPPGPPGADEGEHSTERRGRDREGLRIEREWNGAPGGPQSRNFH